MLRRIPFPKIGSDFGHVKQVVGKQRVTTFAWRPGSQYGVAVTRGADGVLAGDCRARFGRPSGGGGMSLLCDSTVAGPTGWRDNVLASKCENPPFRYPPAKCA